MTRRIHPRALLILAALAAACGDDGGDSYDEPSGDQSNVTAWDGGHQDAGYGDAGAHANPWNAGFQDGAVADAGGWGGNATYDAGAGWGDSGQAGADAATHDAGATDAGGSGAVDAGGADAGAVACASLTYESFGKQFMSDYCVSCHGAVNPRNNVRLDSLAGVVAKKAGVKSAVSSGAMPQGNKKPSTAERTKLGQWLDCGPK